MDVIYHCVIMRNTLWTQCMFQYGRAFSMSKCSNESRPYLRETSFKKYVHVHVFPQNCLPDLLFWKQKINRKLRLDVWHFWPGTCTQSSNWEYGKIVTGMFPVYMYTRLEVPWNHVKIRWDHDIFIFPHKTDSTVIFVFLSWMHFALFCIKYHFRL